MKYFFLPALILTMAAAAVPAQAETLSASRLEVQTKSALRQVSTPSELSEEATFHDLIRHNRRARNKG
ncbi:MAG: hypothetical protein ACFB14_11170 [Leptolyngbyaceae cyanobacterium]